MHRIPLAPLAACAALGLAAAPVEGQSLRGSPSSVDRMYREARAHDLAFHRTTAAARAAVSRGELVRLTGNADYRLHEVSHPYVLPATHTFLLRLSAQYRRACGERLVVTSALRPTTLRLVNSSPKSVHPAGMALDFRKSRNPRCVSWLRSTLLHLERAGVIEATEENRPPHFHVAVFPTQYRRYVQGRPGGGASRQALAAAAPANTSYRVRQGDSLWSIARRHGTSVERIKEANEIGSSRILPGQVLVIPVAR